MAMVTAMAMVMEKKPRKRNKRIEIREYKKAEEK